MTTSDYLIFDFGASSGRALLAKFNGKKVEFSELHRFENQPVKVAGTLYWDILRLYSDLTAGLQKAVKYSGKIVSLGVNTWGVDGGFLDRNGKLIANPVNYRDERRNSLAREVFQAVPEKELFNLTGLFPHSISTLCLFYALKKDSAAEIKYGSKFLMLPDLFNYFLTGAAGAEYSDASTTGLLNQTTGKWENRIFKKLALPRMVMPEIIPAGTRLGKIDKAISAELNIPQLTVVTVAGHDTASAVAGVPATGSQSCLRQIRQGGKWAFISLGTWAVFGIERDKPLLNDAVFENGFWNAGGAEDNTFLAGSYTGLFIIQQCFDFWQRERHPVCSWKRIIAECAKSPPFRSLIDVDDPRFSAFQPDMPRVMADYCRGLGQKTPETMGAIARCCYESLVLKTKSVFHIYEKILGEKFAVIHMVGGGIRNTLLCQWMADALGVPVRAGPAEATVAGNFLVQLKAAGKISSIAEGRSIIADSVAIKEYTPGNSRNWDNVYKMGLACKTN